MICDLASQLRESLAWSCERIEIAGSIRRLKHNPKDIELVAIPKFEYAHDMFGNQIHPVSGIDKWMVVPNEWELDRVMPRNGEKYKRLRHKKTQICCDLFLTDAERWGVIFTIRTGPVDFSTALMKRALGLGMKVDDGYLWKVRRDGSKTKITTKTEYDFFDALKVPYLEPHDRIIQNLNRSLFPKLYDTI